MSLGVTERNPMRHKSPSFPSLGRLIHYRLPSREKGDGNDPKDLSEEPGDKPKLTPCVGTESGVCRPTQEVNPFKPFRTQNGVCLLSPVFVQEVPEWNSFGEETYVSVRTYD